MEQLLHTRRAVNGDILPSARVAERRRNPAPSARALRLRVQRQARLRALLLVAPNIELTASQATYLQCRAGARESKPGSLNGPSRRENRLAWAAIRKPAEVNCPAALARAGYPWGCNTPRGWSGRSCDEVARWSPQRARSPGETDRRTSVRPSGAGDGGAVGAGAGKPIKTRAVRATPGCAKRAFKLLRSAL
jgi:hypothetical protein